MKRTDVVLTIGMLATVLVAWVALAATGVVDHAPALPAQEPAVEP